MKTCPRCGAKGIGIYKKNVSQGLKYSYYYFAHSGKEYGKKTLKWCYLGKKKDGFYPAPSKLSKSDKTNEF